MQQLPIKQKVARVVPFLQQAGLLADPPPCETAPFLTQILQAAGDRVKVAGDILDFADFFTPDDQLTYDEKAFDKRLRKPSDAAGLLATYRNELAEVEPFDVETLDAAMKRFAGSQNIEIGQVIHAVRVAVTGKAVGCGMFETLAILGRERCLARIDRALAQINA
jgi:glutamyl-tRNA synthetase